MSSPREMFVGRCRIVSAKGWETSDIGGIDYRVSLEDDGPVIECAWAGDDDGTETSGRGWAQRDSERLTGQIFFFGADEFQFEAVLLKPRRSSRDG